jgi:hypothetical protein
MEITGDIKYDFIKSYDSDFFTKNPDLDFVLMRKYLTGTYPDKVVFTMPVPESLNSWVSKKPSKVRCSLNKVVKNLNNYNLNIEPLTPELLDEWYIGYKSFLNEIPHGIDRVDTQRVKTSIGEYTLVISRDSENVIQGGAILKKIEEKLSYSYAWYSDEFKKVGGSTACIIKSIEYAIANEFNIFTLGMDTNLYGGHLSLGLLHYKSSLMDAHKMRDAAMYKIFVNPNTQKSFCYFLIEDDKLKKIHVNQKT